MTTFRLTEQHYDLFPGIILEYVKDDTTSPNSFIMKKFGVDSSPLYIVPKSKLKDKQEDEHFSA